MEGLSWLRFVLNKKGQQPDIHYWDKVYEFAFNHSLLGICNPFSFEVKLPQDLLFQWIGDVEQLKVANRQLNKQTAEVCELFRKSGFQTCVLKGQGNALMYPDSLLRCPGDIDVWVDSGKKTLYSFVKRLYPTAKEGVKHISFDLFSEVGIDAHYTPQKMFYPIHNKRLRQWLEEQKKEQFGNLVRLPMTDEEIAIPTAKFNAVYQLGHILMHLLEAGIGLRQFVDYYFVLRQCERLTEPEKNAVRGVWRKVGTSRFAAGVMWVEKEVLGLPESSIFIEPDEQFGKFIAEDVLESGNFGKHSKWAPLRRKGRFIKSIVDIWRYIRLMRFMPLEATFRLIFKIKTTVRIMIKKISSKCYDVARELWLNSSRRLLYGGIRME